MNYGVRLERHRTPPQSKLKAIGPSRCLIDVHDVWADGVQRGAAGKGFSVKASVEVHRMRTGAPTHDCEHPTANAYCQNCHFFPPVNTA